MSEMMSPAIMEALGGAQGAPPGQEMGGMPPMGGAEPPMPEPAPEGGGDTVDLIRQALELVRQYAAEEESEQNTMDAEKITSLLQGILAAEEKELEQAMQGKASPRILRSAYGG